MIRGHFWNDGVRPSKNLYHKRMPAKTKNPLFQNSGNWSLATIKGLFIQEKQLDLRTASFVSFWLTLISCPQIYDSLENQQPCNYSRCENQQPSSHSSGRIGFAFNRSFISRELWPRQQLLVVFFFFPLSGLTVQTALLPAHLPKTTSSSCLMLHLPELVVPTGPKQRLTKKLKG